MSETTQDVVELARTSVRQGDRAMTTGDVAAARQAYLDALEHLPNHSEILVKLGEACLLLGQGIPAERSFAVVLNAPPGTIHPGVYQAAFYGLVKAYVLNGRHARVAQMLLKNEKAISHDRPFFDATAVALTFTGNVDLLAPHADEIIQFNPLPAQARLAAVGMIQAGAVDSGLRILTAVVEADSADPEVIALYWRGLALARSDGGIDDLVENAKRSMRVAQSPVYVHYQLARYLDVTGRLDTFDADPEFALHADVRRAIPVASGCSRVLLEPPDTAMLKMPRIDPAELADMAFFEGPKCGAVFSLLLNRPVHSITTSTPISPHGSLEGSRCANTRIVSPLTTMLSPSTWTSPLNLPWTVS